MKHTTLIKNNIFLGLVIVFIGLALNTTNIFPYAGIVGWTLSLLGVIIALIAGIKNSSIGKKNFSKVLPGFVIIFLGALLSTMNAFFHASIIGWIIMFVGFVIFIVSVGGTNGKGGGVKREVRDEAQNEVQGEVQDEM